VAKLLFLEELDRARTNYGFSILGYVITPEHVHLVIYPPDGMPLGLVVREMKSRSAKQLFARERRAKESTQRVFWQKRCYDHNCRTRESTFEKITYCHNNPVRRGLVSDPGEWRWSSCNCYYGSDGILLRVDRIQL